MQWLPRFELLMPPISMAACAERPYRGEGFLLHQLLILPVSLASTDGRDVAAALSSTQRLPTRLDQGSLTLPIEPAVR